MNDCPHGQQKRTCETCEAQDFAAGWQKRAEAAEAERDHESGLRQGLDRLANTLFEERGEARAERDRLRAIVDLVKEYRVQHGRFWLLEDNEDEAVASAERESQAWSKVVSALDALDGSAEVTDG